MAKKSIILGTTIATISFILIVSSIPIVFISSHLSTYKTISKQLTYEYSPSSPSSIEILNLNVDVGNIKINYFDPPVDYQVKIDVYIEMSGSHLVGKSYLDYFNITWQDESSQANFTLELISDDWFSPSIWFNKSISVDVSIRKGIVFDIITTVNEGNVEISALWKSSFKNLIVNVTNGDIIYDFESCIIDGNITGSINTGDLVLNSYNVEYSRNSNWALSSQNGNMEIDIYQYREMGANITGVMEIKGGDLILTYRDYDPSIGALFTFPLELPPLIPPPMIGFELKKINLTGHYYKSYDFPAKSNFNLLFNCSHLDDNDHHINLMSH